MNFRETLFSKKVLFFIAGANFLGTLFGFYYYIEQLTNTPVYLWIFVPASPLATLFLVISIYFNLKDREIQLIDSLAFIGNFKYGLWTVFCLIYYSHIFFGADSTLLYSFMILSHFGMFIQSFLVFGYSKIDYRPFILAFLWFELNDIIDYTLGTHTELYTDYIYPAEVAAYTLTILALLSGLALIQKDRILNRVREVRKV